MNLAKARFRIIPVFIAIFASSLIASPAFASTSGTSVPALHIAKVFSTVTLLDPSFNPQTGGVPFCDSVGSGTILCYTPNFLKSAYNFPSSSGDNGLNGKGSTIVIVDAFGSPTLQSDLNTFDKSFNIPPTKVTILCGPTWTGSPSDKCPVKTLSDLSTAPNAALCGAFGWAEETTLDVTMAHGLAPGAKIVVVVANDCFDSNLYGAELAVVTQHQFKGSIMSQSFGSPDDLQTCATLDPTNTYCISRDPTLLNLPNTVYRTAKENHWTVIASTGDDGANEAGSALGNYELTPSFPASSPLVLAAGGTQGNPYGGSYGPPPGPGGVQSCPANTICNTGLVLISGGKSGCTTALRPGVPSSCKPVGYGGEAAWNEANVFGLRTSTGGGVSSIFDRPSYQEDLPNSVTTLFGNTVELNGRTTPDVSFNSAIQGGFLVPIGFLPCPLSSTCPGPDWAVFGGTSAASPAWAGIIALLNQANGGPVGFVNPAIYQLGQNDPRHDAAPFHDITNGQNSDTGGINIYGIPNPVCYPPLTGSPLFPPGAPSAVGYPSGCLTWFDGFQSGQGYDLTTGWGTPNVSVFIHSIVNLLQDNNN